VVVVVEEERIVVVCTEGIYHHHCPPTTLSNIQRIFVGEYIIPNPPVFLIRRGLGVKHHEHELNNLGNWWG